MDKKTASGIAVAAAVGITAAVLLTNTSTPPPFVPPPIPAPKSVNLEWNPSPDDIVAGYQVYYGIASRDYWLPLDVGTNLTATVSNLIPGETYSFSITAYAYFFNDILSVTDRVESDFSDELIWHVADADGWVKMRFQFPLLTLHTNDSIQQSPELAQWTNSTYCLPIGTNAAGTIEDWLIPLDTSSGATYFRIKL